MELYGLLTLHFLRYQQQEISHLFVVCKLCELLNVYFKYFWCTNKTKNLTLKYKITKTKFFCKSVTHSNKQKTKKNLITDLKLCKCNKKGKRTKWASFLSQPKHIWTVNQILFVTSLHYRVVSSSSHSFNICPLLKARDRNEQFIFVCQSLIDTWKGECGMVRVGQLVVI